MAARRRPTKSSGPLDDRQQKLLEEQEKLQRRMEQLKHMIDEAPKIKEAKVRARRDALLADRSNRGHQFNSQTIADTRFGQFGTTGSRSRRKPLKAERRQTQLMFLGLLLVLSVLVVWLLSVWHWQWPG